MPKNGLVLLKNSVGAIELYALLTLYEPAQWSRLHNACVGEGGTWISFVVLLSCLVGTGIAYAGLWLQSVVTATTFMVIGCATKVLVILWGIVLWGDAKGAVALGGALVSMGGALLYSLQSWPCSAERLHEARAMRRGFNKVHSPLHPPYISHISPVYLPPFDLPLTSRASCPSLRFD